MRARITGYPKRGPAGREVEAPLRGAGAEAGRRWFFDRAGGAREWLEGASPETMRSGFFQTERKAVQSQVGGGPRGVSGGPPDVRPERWVPERRSVARCSQMERFHRQPTTSEPGPPHRGGPGERSPRSAASRSGRRCSGLATNQPTAGFPPRTERTAIQSQVGGGPLGLLGGPPDVRPKRWFPERPSVARHSRPDSLHDGGSGFRFLP